MEVLNIEQAAQLLGVSENTIKYLTSTQQIPFSRIGKRKVRYSKERLEIWFQDRENVAVSYNKGPHG